MKTGYVAAVLLMVLGLSARAEETEKAEAQRRNVPVAQVQAERALAAEKKKTADAEAKLTDLKKQLSDLEARDAAANSTAEANPAEGGAFYREVSRRYLGGDWETLLADIAKNQKDLATLSKEEAANVEYIKAAVTEGRQAWWDQVKKAKTGPFKASVWGQQVDFTFTGASAPHFSGPNGATVAAMSWPREWMDAFTTMPMLDAGLDLNANFRRGDGVNSLIWGYMSFGDLFATLGPEKIRAMKGAEKKQFDVYSGFWTGVTAGYYGTPPARRLMLVEALASFEKLNDTRPDWLGKRPIGAAFLVEMKVHKYTFYNEHMRVLGLDRLDDPHDSELFEAKPLVLALANAKLDFEDDKRIREMFKALADANHSWETSKLSLPHGLSYDLNIEDDIPLGKERMQFKP
jgi:hypothetical protein